MRNRLCWLVLCACLLWAGESWAQTCRSEATVPTYPAGQQVPQVCDTHGTQKVMTVDENGDYVAGGGGGGGGDASAANQDEQTAILTTIDADTSALAAAADNGALHVIIDSGAGSGGTASDDDADFTAGATAGTPAMGVYQSSPSNVTDGDLGIVGITQDRRLRVDPGTVTVTDGSGALNVIVDSGTITAVTAISNALPAGNNNIGDVDVATLPGTGVEDAGETAGGTLHMMGSVRRDTAASSAGTTGDNATINTDASGRLWVNPGTIGVEDAAETAAGNLNMVGTVRRDTAASSAGTTGDNATLNTDANGKLWTNADVTAVVPGTGATALGKAEDAAHTTGDTGVAILCRRIDSAASSAGTSGDYATVDCDSAGRTRVAATIFDSSGNEVTFPTAGLTSYLSSAASTNATSVKGSAGTVYGYNLINTTSTLYYLRMYNLSSAPTCSSSTGFVQSIPIPASTSGAGVQIQKNIGQAFTTGIAFCLTGGAGSTDNTNAATGVFVDILYK